MVRNNDNKKSKTENETHYKALISFFKYLISITGGVLSIIFIVTGILFFQDRASMRRELTEVKKSAQEAIENTKDKANFQINEIRSTAKEIALDEAKKRVTTAFQEKNIKSMIDSAAKDIVMKSVQSKLKDAIDTTTIKIENDLTELSNIYDAAMKMRMGLRSGLTDLNNLIKTSENIYLKNSAVAIYKSICNDYDSVQTKSFNKLYPDSTKFNKLKKLSLGFEVIKVDIPNLIKMIKTGENLNDVAFSFIILRKKTNKQFRMFDIQQIDYWWSENKNKYIEQK